MTPHVVRHHDHIVGKAPAKCSPSLFAPGVSFCTYQAYKTTEALARRIEITVNNLVRGLAGDGTNKVA